MTAAMRYAHPDAIVATQWLADNLGDPALRVFDCTTYLHYETGTGRPYRVESGRADYERGHIPGSAFLDLQGELSDGSSGINFTMPAADDLAARFAAKGIGAVLYVRTRLRRDRGLDPDRAAALLSHAAALALGMALATAGLAPWLAVPALGVLLAVAEANCRYSSPARFDEEVIIRTWVEDANPRMVTFAYEMRLAENGRKLVSGYTRHVFVGRDLKPCRMPQKYRSKFGL